eukprot:15333634-Ditylum_brightwellii.AAC.1
MSPMLDLIEDDNVMVELLSFLDFRTAVRAGQTCHRLKTTSYRALDGWVNRVMNILPCEAGFNEDYGDVDFARKGILRRGWSAEHQSREALIKNAVQEIRHNPE